MKKKKNKKRSADLSWALFIKWNFLIWYFLTEHNNQEFRAEVYFIQKTDRNWPLLLTQFKLECISLEPFCVSVCVLSHLKMEFLELRIDFSAVLHLFKFCWRCVLMAVQCGVLPCHLMVEHTFFARQPASNKKQSTINQAISVRISCVVQWIHQFC